MKKHLLQFAYVAAIYGLVLVALSCDAQTTTRDAQGNYIAAPREVKAERDTVTGLTYTDTKGVVHPVYVGGKGSHYVARVSKTGKYYRQYLKKD